MNSKQSTSIKSIILITFIGSVLFFFLSPVEKDFKNYTIYFGISLMYTLGYALPNGILNNYLNKKYSWITQTKQRTFWGILGTLLLNVFLTYVLNYVNFVLIQGVKPDDFFGEKWNFTNWFFINFALLVSAILHAHGFIKALKQNTKQEVNQQKIIASSANAQFQSLKNQLDPHFLFNSLNVLNALIDENPKQAQHFSNSMSKIYRYILEQKDKELVTIEEELDFAYTYAELLKTRFEDSVDFDIKVSNQEKSFYVVPLSLQLLLENAIKHNFATSLKPLKIKIYTENLELVVENNLQEREKTTEREGIGLSNIVQRYSLLTKENIFIEKSEDFYKVKIPILKEKTKTMEPKNTTSENFAYQKAAKRVEELKGFYGNLISYVLIIPILFIINWRTSPQYWWAFWPMLGWGIGLVSHAFKVFGIGRDWEEKQIQKILEKENYGKQ